MAESFKTVPLWINGKEEHSDHTFSVISPESDKECWTASSATIDQATAAIEAAQAAFPLWSATKPTVRERVLTKAADLIEERAEHLTKIMAAELSPHDGVAPFLLMVTTSLIRDTASRAMTIQGAVPVVRDAGRSAMVFKEPYGVMLGIVPWNAPCVLGSRAIATAIATGNTTVIKGSEKTPRCFLELVKIFEDAGLPKGVVNLIYTSASESATIVEAIVRHPAVRKINFTGSTEVGRAVARVCGAHLKPCLMELGGKNTAIVLSDADLNIAALQCVLGAFLNSGQTCMATDRVLVMSDIAIQFEQAVKAAITNVFATPVPPKVISSASKQRLAGIVSDALSHGAHIIHGDTSESNISNKPNGTHFTPIVLGNIIPSMQAWQEEHFGPVFGIRIVQNEQEAIKIANDTTYGLSMSIFSKDLRKAFSIAKKLESGAVHINSMTLHDEGALPFGGIKNSGWGRFNAAEGMEEFLVTKTVTWDD